MSPLGSFPAMSRSSNPRRSCCGHRHARMTNRRGGVASCVPECTGWPIRKGVKHDRLTAITAEREGDQNRLGGAEAVHQTKSGNHQRVRQRRGGSHREIEPADAVQEIDTPMAITVTMAIERRMLMMLFGSRKLSDAGPKRPPARRRSATCPTCRENRKRRLTARRRRVYCRKGLALRRRSPFE